jgi:uncharacterized membrane protein
MSESPTLIIAAIVTGIIAILGALGTLITGIQTRNLAKNTRDLTSELGEGQKAIHVLVNSRLSKALEEIEILRTTISALTRNPVDEKEAKKAIVEASRVDK